MAKTLIYGLIFLIWVVQPAETFATGFLHAVSTGVSNAFETFSSYVSRLFPSHNPSSPPQSPGQESAKASGGEDKNDLRKMVRSEILKLFVENEDKIVDNILNQIRRKKDIQHALTTRQIFENHTHPSWGAPDSQKVAVVFTDPYCFHCDDALDAFDVHIQKNPGHKLIIHIYPLLGKPSQQAARALLAAHCRGHYTQFYKSFRHRVNQIKKPLSEAQLLEIAVKLGLDGVAFKTDVKGPKVADLLKESVRLGQVFHVTATPTFILMRKTPKNAKAGDRRLSNP